MPRELREVPVKQGPGIRKSRKVFGQGQKTAKMVCAGLYARVSTQDQQTLPMQNRAMREYAARRGWTIAMQVKEVGSGAAQRQRREEMLEAARRREIDVVVVWRLDRWGRSVTDRAAKNIRRSTFGISRSCAEGGVSSGILKNSKTPLGSICVRTISSVSSFI